MRISMSKAEINRIEVMEKLKRGKIVQEPASDMIGRSVKACRGKLFRYKVNGTKSCRNKCLSSSLQKSSIWQKIIVNSKFGSSRFFH